jgi:hypothetical protein
MQYKIYKKVYEKNSYAFKWVIGANLQFLKTFRSFKPMISPIQ